MQFFLKLTKMILEKVKDLWKIWNYILKFKAWYMPKVVEDSTAVPGRVIYKKKKYLKNLYVQKLQPLGWGYVIGYPPKQCIRENWMKTRKTTRIQQKINI